MSIPTTEQLVAIADEASERAFAQGKSNTQVISIREAAVRDAVLEGLAEEAHKERRLTTSMADGTGGASAILADWLRSLKGGPQ